MEDKIEFERIKKAREKDIQDFLLEKLNPDTVNEFMNLIYDYYTHFEKQFLQSQHDLKVANKMVDLVFDRWGCDRCPLVCFKKENQPNCREMNFNNFKTQAIAQLNGGNNETI